jgi:hypothetical protein
MTFCETSYVQCLPFSLIESEGPIIFYVEEELSSGRVLWEEGKL